METGRKQIDLSLICEALVREISHAQRWSAIEEAWEALLHVRRFVKEMKSEPPDSCCGGSEKHPHRHIIRDIQTIIIWL